MDFGYGRIQIALVVAMRANNMLSFSIIAREFTALSTHKI